MARGQNIIKKKKKKRICQFSSHYLILWRSSCRAEAEMVPCDETNLLAPPPIPLPPLPPTVAKLDTLFSEVNCLLPNVGAGLELLLSRPTLALPRAFSAEVACQRRMTDRRNNKFRSSFVEREIRMSVPYFAFYVFVIPVEQSLVWCAWWQDYLDCDWTGSFHTG